MSHRYLPLIAASCLVGQVGCSPGGGVRVDGAGGDTRGERYLGLNTPEDGFQVRAVGATIPAGQDQEFCEVAELPGSATDTYFVNTIEMANGAGSHHLIVSIAPPGSQSDAKLRTLQIGDRVPCLAARVEFGEDLLQVGGIQHPYGKVELPEGLAREFAGGSRVVFDYHYFNASDVDIEARSAFNFHLTARSKVKQLAGGFGFFNWTIDTKPGQKGSFTADCRFQKDAVVGSLTRHTHQWGRDFSAWFAGGDEDGTLVWTTPDFNTDTDHVFTEPVRVRAGEGFRFECDYDNTESYALRFGTKAKDEMCILFGSVWDPAGAYDPPTETCEVTWIDDAGIGRPASHEGAFPQTPEETQLCLGGAGEAPDDCVQCGCSSCASVLIQCFTDAECGPIVRCFQSGGDCLDTISEHSAGLGLAQQVSACTTTKCAETCGGEK